ncbi:MAG: shikimate kinase [Gemmatimonadaceae bacterium]|nr:shikimate kinase [Gemmatimonadaceae bacterium]
MRVLIFGNSGSGKSTMAARLADERGLTHLDLDSLAWSAPAVRRPFEQSAQIIAEFVARNPEWVVEGCYADLLALVATRATELRFLNPGIDACVANCRARLWEPSKYPSKEDQDARLPALLDWVRQYETRDDEYSLSAHRRLFDSFTGPKDERR